jgi:hypothetical protein
MMCGLDCNRDSIREYTSSYDIICYQMLNILFAFILSEIMFILVYFWSSCSTTYSSSSRFYYQTIQDLMTQDPNSLTSTNTVLLS